MDERLAELEKRAEALRRDQKFSRHLNSSMVPITLQRFEVGADSIERLRTRVKAISQNPLSEPHTIWNAQNFLEQVEAAMEKADPIPPIRTLNREQATEVTDAYQSGDTQRIEAIRIKYGVEAVLEAKDG